MTTIQKAIEIFKTSLPEAKGKFSARLSELNSNVVEILSDGILYCSINTHSGLIKGV